MWPLLPFKLTIGLKLHMFNCGTWAWTSTLTCTEKKYKLKKLLAIKFMIYAIILHWALLMLNHIECCLSIILPKVSTITDY